MAGGFGIICSESQSTAMAMVEIISPSSWQNTCGIHKRSRDERKAGARKFVENYYGLSDVIQDVVDSICIGYHYIRENGLERSAF